MEKNDAMKNIIIKKLFRTVEIIHEEGILALIKRPLTKIKMIFYVLYLREKIKRLNRNYKLGSLFDFAYIINEGLLRPNQIRSELLALLQIIKKKKPKFLLEIGTATGGTLFLLSRMSVKDAVIISIDLPGGNFGGGFPKWKLPLFKSFACSNQEIFFIRADSHDKNSLVKIKEILKGNKLDFLFIDGDHRYIGVKKDFEMYSPLVKKSGYIGFHDIVFINHPEDNFGVHDFWNEIKENYIYEEIVEDWNQNSSGIGILKSKSKKK